MMFCAASSEQVPVEEQTLTTRVAKFDDIGDMYLEDCTLQDTMQVRPFLPCVLCFVVDLCLVCCSFPPRNRHSFC